MEPLSTLQLVEAAKTQSSAPASVPRIVFERKSGATKVASIPQVEARSRDTL